MKRLHARLAGTSILAATLLACTTATQVPTANELSPAPKAQIYPQLAPTHENAATITVVRDVGFTASLVHFHVAVDGIPVVALAPGEYFSFLVDPGDHQLSVIPTNVFAQRKPTALAATWRPGQQVLYRVGMDANMAVTLMRDPRETRIPARNP